MAKKMGVNLDPMDISACHTLEGKRKPPSIVLHLTSRKVKAQILKASKHLRGSKVYINEHLTSKMLFGQRTDSDSFQIKDMADFVRLNSLTTLNSCKQSSWNKLILRAVSLLVFQYVSNIV